MRIIEIGVRELLMNRLQCMRDINNFLDDSLDEMIERRESCCASSSSSSDSSSLSSSSSSSGVTIPN